jgi:hypothetical protein
VSASAAGRRSRNRGKVGEREVADLLRSAGWPAARRGVQHAGGPDSPDVVGGPAGWHVEVKRTEALNVWRAMAQAVADAQGRPALVLTRRNGARWLAVLDAEVLLALLRWAEDQPGSPFANGLA